MAPNRRVKTYDASGPSGGWPRGSHIKYQCDKCGCTIPSDPEEYAECACENISIDVDAGRFLVRDKTSKVRVIEDGQA